MKIDRTKLKKSSTEVPADCKSIIDSLKTSVDAELHEALKFVKNWTHGKCELYHWVDVLDVFDGVLERACHTDENKWTLACDQPYNHELKELMLQVLQFTALLIEHSFSRHMYNSMEHLTTLLASCDMGVVLCVLNLLYVFSKRSNFITRLTADRKQPLVARLINLSENWGGKENGFGLAECCSNLPMSKYPSSATTLHFEYYAENKDENPDKKSACYSVVSIHMEKLDELDRMPSEIMEDILAQFDIPVDKQVQLYTHVRLATSFSNYNIRVQCVQARLQALSILVYSNSIPESVNSLVYTGLIEELVDVVRLDNDELMEIKAASLRTLTSIIHLERVPKLNVIIDVTGAASYHGFLPVLVRSCIRHMIDRNLTTFPQPFATALFSFLYHLASYENGGETLVTCGMMESLLQVINWYGEGQEHITFVTRAVRVVDLITNLDMAAFQTNSGLSAFINRLENEVDICRKYQPFVIKTSRRSTSEYPESPPVVMETDSATERGDISASASTSDAAHETTPMKETKTGSQCFPQRAALLKSMLNFLKKAIPDPSFSDSIRHLMDGSLPATLKHIISNAEYYGPSLFLLATDVVSVYVFQEPSLLSSLQDNGLTDVVLQALLVKDVPATREVLAFLPNVFSALCLNSRGLESFVQCRPFDRLLKVLLSPDYLPAMRRRRSADPHGDTATNLGKAMDELMRHQPSLRTDATKAIIKLLEEVCAMGSDPKYVCQKPALKTDAPPQTGAPRSPQQADGGSSDEDEDEEDMVNVAPADPAESTGGASAERQAIPLMDYVLNVMKFVQAILSNNPTDDHCREFVAQKGLFPLMTVLGLPNLPIDFPSSPACQSVAIVCKAILTLAREPMVLKQGLIHLDKVLATLEPLHQSPPAPGGSVLLQELANASHVTDPTSNPVAVPLLHALSATHAYITMFVHICRIGQTDIRTISVNHWGSELGLQVLEGLSKLYTSLVWESTVLLALCSDDILPPDSDFGRDDMERLLRKESKVDPKDDPAKTQQPNDGNRVVYDPTSMLTSDATSSEPRSGERDANDSPFSRGLTRSHGDLGSNGVSEALHGLTTAESALSDEDLVDKAKLSASLQAQIKLVKPLLSVTSRLGRALADLFGLLVKLGVGTPVRQRRTHQMPNTPTTPTPAAQAVCVALNKLLATALNWIPPQHCPVPKLRLTFLVCSVGFTSAMLFYEKKQPYHLMLQKFVSSGGQSALFQAFYWALNMGGTATPACGMQDCEIPEGTGEFLDAWLMLIEKMVNPRTVLDSPHTLPCKSTQPEFVPFDPTLYLPHIHKLAFDAAMMLWNKKPLAIYGSRMCESVLAILCHIIKGEIIIKEQKNNADVAQATDSAPSGNSVVALSVPPVPGPANSPAVISGRTRSDGDDELQQLQDMGFTGEQAMEALLHSTTLEQAAEYILSQATPEQRIGFESEDDQMMRAIAMSLGEDTATSSEPGSGTKSESATSAVADAAVPDKYEPLEQEELDKFTDGALTGCLYWLDKIPETVYRVCDLILIVTLRNGRVWRSNAIDYIVSEIVEMGETMLKVMRPALTSDEKMLQEVSAYLASMWCTPRFAVRIHLLSLLFEDMMMACAEVVEKRNLLDQLVEVLNLAVHILSVSKDCDKHKWMAPLILLIDLYEKVSITSRRKAAADAIMKDSYHTWKWLDDRSGRWCNYSSSNNKTINDAYLVGEASIRFTAGRRRYTVHFSSMVQVNEETGNRRPIMLTLPSKEEKDKEEAAENKETNKQSAAAAPTVDECVGGASSQDVKMDTTDEATCGAGASNDGSIARGRDTPVVVTGLSHQQIVSLLQCIVKLIGIPVDADSLHACLRLALRLTRQHKYALLFAQYGGTRLLLALRQASSFQGVSSLINLLLRHVIEQPTMMRVCMEKVIRSATTGTGSAGTGVAQGTLGSQELHYILRLLGPAACRDSALLCEVIQETLRIALPPVSKREDFRYQGVNAPQILKCVPAKVTPIIAMDSVVQTMICDLMNSLIVFEKPPIDDRGGSDMSSDSQTKIQQSLAEAMRDVVFDDAHDGNDSNMSSARNPVIISSSADDQAESSSSEDFMKEKIPPKDAAVVQEENKKRLLMSKSLLLRLLAECVKSYNSCAKVIALHTYTADPTTLVTEDCTMLAFVMDKLLPQCQTIGDRDCSGLACLLIASIASCNHSSDAQLTLVNEIKAALQRAVALHECSEKHSRLQALFNILSVIIEACPNTTAAASSGSTTFKTAPAAGMNNIVKMIVKRNIITDLARIPHNLDLSSPYMATTMNSALKPLETLTRLVNQPQPAGAAHKVKAKDGVFGAADDPVDATSVPATAQTSHPPEHPADTPTVEGDGSGREESDTRVMERSQLDSVLDDLLQRNGDHHPEHQVCAEINITNAENEPDLSNDVLILEVQGDDTVEIDVHDSQMVTQEISDTEDDRRHHDTGHDNASNDSCSEGEHADHDDDDDDDDEDEHDDDDDDDDDDGSEMDADDENFEVMELDETFAQYDTLVRLEDVFPQGQHIIMNDNGQMRTYQVPVVMTDNDNGNDATGPMIPPPPSTVTGSHPLLVRHPEPHAVVGNIPARVVRGNRTRGTYRFSPNGQALQVNITPGATRHPSPPDILQRLLGPSTAADVLQLTNSTPSQAGQQNSPRILVANDTLNRMLALQEDDIFDELFQDGMYRDVPGTGSSVNNILSCIPSTLMRWTEESRVLDGDSIHDCVTVLKPLILEVLEKYRNEELEERQDKKRKADEDKATAENTLKCQELKVENTACMTHQDMPSTAASECMADTPLTPTGIDAISGYSSATTTPLGPPTPAIIDASSVTTRSGTPIAFGVSMDDNWITSIASRVVDVLASSTPTTASSDVLNIPLVPLVAPIPVTTPTSTQQQPLTSSGDNTMDSTADPSAAAERLATAMIERVFSVQSAPTTDYITPVHPIPLITPTAPRSHRPPHTQTPVVVPPMAMVTPPVATSPATDRAASTVVSAMDVTPAPSGGHEHEMSSLMSLLLHNEDDSSNAAAMQQSTLFPAGLLSSTHPRGDEIMAESVANDAAITPEEPSNMTSSDAVTVNSSASGTPDEVAVRDGMGASQTMTQLGEALIHSLDSSLSILPPISTATVTTTTSASVAASQPSSMFGNVALPDGVDPSFLAALPESIRQEVIAEQLRLQRIQNAAARQQTQQQSDTGGSGASALEVNPEFLAALPPNIQEEVLAQQRSEQARLLSEQGGGNPDLPVDPGSFIASLPQSLRQQVLADMDDSMVAVLPPDLAMEAQTLRQELEDRHRRLMHERLFTGTGSGSLSAILRHSGLAGRLGNRYAIRAVNRAGGVGRGTGAWNWRNNTTDINPNAARIKGRQLLDHEAFTCLLVLLFIDEPKLNTVRLHRVLRNLCYHAPSRAWVIGSLLSILHRSAEGVSDQPDDHQQRLSPSKHGEKRRKSSNAMQLDPHSALRSEYKNQSAWLSVSLEAALGCRAGVFQISKPGGKKQTAAASSTPPVTIHPQAAPVVCRHVLDTLISLAKSFPNQFLPQRPAEVKCENIADGEKPPKPATTGAPANAPASNRPDASVAKDPTKPTETDFWDLLVRLDGSSGNRKGKGLQRSHSYNNIESEKPFSSFETSPLGQLLSMLSHSVIRKSQLLTDRLLRLVGLLSVSVPGVARPPITTIAAVATVATVTSASLSSVTTTTASPAAQQPLTTSMVQATQVPFVTPTTPIATDVRDEPVTEETKPPTERASSPADVTEEAPAILVSQLPLAVKVLTSKSCSEEGLEDVTSLLLQLSRANNATRDAILALLLDGAMLLGQTVSSHITQLLGELHEHKAKTRLDKDDDVDMTASAHAKGIMHDRFQTGSTIVVSAPVKPKCGRELHLPSMSCFTSKDSSQQFFLRVLKVIIQLREAARTAAKKAPTKTPNAASLRYELNNINERMAHLEAEAEAIMEMMGRRDRQHLEQSAITATPAIHRPGAPLSATPSASMNIVAGTTQSTAATAVISTHTAVPDLTASQTVVVSAPPQATQHTPMEVDGLANRGGDETGSKDGDDAPILPRLSEQLLLQDLWDTLSDCLMELSTMPDHHAVLILQPTVEAFFIVHAGETRTSSHRNRSHRREDDLAHIREEQQDAPPSPAAHDPHSNLMDTSLASISHLPLDTQKFLKFAETHRTVLNQILRQTTTHLTDGPFSVLVDHTRILDFDVKRRYFRQELERLDEGMRREDLPIHVRREHVFEDSFRELHRHNADEWKHRFYIVFEGEEGQDAGGLLREWYMIISREIFNPMYALFKTSPGDRVTYTINHLSYCNSNHLSYFKFVGRIIAKAIYDNKLLECYFTRSFYKHMIGHMVKYTDMESEDYAFYQGLVFLLENNVKDLGYELMFSTEVQEFGVNEVRDLKPNGRNLPVTEDNKREYIHLVCQMKMTSAIRQQLNAFLEGFYDIIPKWLISTFNEQELELLISGLPTIDIDDLKANTEYHKYQSGALQIQWFWRSLRSFDQADRARFIQFVTGTSKVPLQGFAHLEGMNGVQKFQIHRDDRSTDRLPSAHTCFNQLDLPAYETYDKLRMMLLLAVNECSEGFGLA